MHVEEEDNILFIQHSRDEPRVRVFEARPVPLCSGDYSRHVVRRGRDERHLEVHVRRPAPVFVFHPERTDALAALHHLAHAFERHRRGVEVSKQPVWRTNHRRCDGVEVDEG